MSIRETSPPSTVATGDTVRRLGMACAASGVLGVLAGVITITLAYPPAVPDDQWSYPFPVGVQWAISVALAVTHALTLAVPRRAGR